jgi:hypothetical protein
MSTCFREAMFEAAIMLRGSRRPSTLTSLRFSSVSRTRLKSFFTAKAQVGGGQDALPG